MDLDSKAFVYLDDIIILEKTFQEHVDTVREVLRRLRDAKLKINPEKCNFFPKNLKYLGPYISEEGISTDPEKINAIYMKDPEMFEEFVGLLE